MAELLLLNPAKRRRRKSAAPKRRRVTARRRRNPTRAVAPRLAVNPRRRRVSRRRRNTTLAVTPRRRNPIRSRLRRAGRRRRNPIGLGSMSGMIRMFKDAAIGAAGAVGVDYAYAYVNAKLPSTLQIQAGKVGVGDGVKALLTVAAGTLLNRVTRGLSLRMAAGALTVQVRDAILKAVPAASVGYYNPGIVVAGNGRVGPNRGINGNGAGANNAMGAYLAPGRTPLLNGRVGAYLAPGRTPLLNGLGSRMPASAREGARYR